MNRNRAADPGLGEGEIVRALKDDLSLAAGHDPGLSGDDVRFLYRHMVTTRGRAMSAQGRGAWTRKRLFRVCSSELGYTSG